MTWFNLQHLILVKMITATTVTTEQRNVQVHSAHDANCIIRFLAISNSVVSEHTSKAADVDVSVLNK